MLFRKISVSADAPLGLSVFRSFSLLKRWGKGMPAGLSTELCIPSDSLGNERRITASEGEGRKGEGARRGLSPLPRERGDEVGDPQS